LWDVDLHVVSYVGVVLVTAPVLETLFLARISTIRVRMEMCGLKCGHSFALVEGKLKDCGTVETDVWKFNDDALGF
jgi:hypothetical protein